MTRSDAPTAEFWGDVDDPAVLARIESHIRAGESVIRLRGSTFGRIGGRSMGMSTAVANTDRWLDQFGVNRGMIESCMINDHRPAPPALASNDVLPGVLT